MLLQPFRMCGNEESRETGIARRCWTLKTTSTASTVELQTEAGGTPLPEIRSTTYSLKTVRSTRHRSKPTRDREGEALDWWCTVSSCLRHGVWMCATGRWLLSTTMTRVLIRDIDYAGELDMRGALFGMSLCTLSMEFHASITNSLKIPWSRETGVLGGEVDVCPARPRGACRCK